VRSPRRLLVLLVLLGLLAWPVAARALSADLAVKLDPRLASALAPDARPVSVWVDFVDKGEQGPGDLLARLAAAERALTPAARRRRERAHVSPLVDYLDLPLCPDYVRGLVAAGFAPYGQSRWFNGCAVRTSGAGLERLASLSWVRRLSPAPLAAPRRPWPLPGPAIVSAPRPGGLAAAGRALLDAGQTQTQLARLGVPALHDSGYVGTGVLICMLDEGFNYYDQHTSTRSLPILATRDFVWGGTSVQDTSSDGVLWFPHGEWTLSCIGGNAPGIYLGPACGATYALARTEDAASEKPIEMVNWLMGAEWADSLGADILSSSLGYNLFPDSTGPGGASLDITYPMLDGHTTIITRAAEIAAAKGILVVNSAGNDGVDGVNDDKICAPADANGDSLIAAGAVDSLGDHAWFSSLGPTYDGRIKPDLAAQGVDVLVAGIPYPNPAPLDPDAYTRLNGTSFSCPLIAGLCACLMQARPNWPPTAIILTLRESASQANHPDTLLGYGIPNGPAALQWGADTIGVPPGLGPLQFLVEAPNPVRSADWPVHLNAAIASLGGPVGAKLRVYDLSGRIVATPWEGAIYPGQIVHALWGGQGADGARVAPGLYLLDFQCGRSRLTRRLVAIR